MASWAPPACGVVEGAHHGDGPHGVADPPVGVRHLLAARAAVTVSTPWARARRYSANRVDASMASLRTWIARVGLTAPTFADSRRRLLANPVS